MTTVEVLRYLTKRHSGFWKIYCIVLAQPFSFFSLLNIVDNCMILFYVIKFLMVISTEINFSFIKLDNTKTRGHNVYFQVTFYRLIRIFLLYLHYQYLQVESDNFLKLPSQTLYNTVYLK
jgi:hypothetical protein